MKPILRLIVASIALFNLVGCESTSGKLKPISQISPSVSSEGTLANAILIQDTENAIYSKFGVNSSGDSNKPEIEKFVIQQPVGESGMKAWREMWIYNPGEPDSVSFIVTFREDGKGSADFELQPMQNK